ncbi:hypothetical protein BCR33DRAFT_724957 [Rhizoclosmatium globosum]|uniref:Uncharacterized protein n=1 Tax=Rhizoclosmatium globosum TaxID=329046 RepID=A0A1Y2B1P8_9FUNG|nr:hypothetical protein BCR33DRAFT_724957 [Rhizoclosmatium globosum]|eukprot:ORY28759.1 hypothetical protein BCR33DRAFT_724957 [Rhizoclosmatium globosum]
MCFCGRISRIGKAKTFKCSNPRCSGRAICSRDSLTFRLPRDIKSGLFIENLTWAIALMRVHHHIRGGGTGGAENNDGNGDPGGGGPGGGRRGGGMDNKSTYFPILQLASRGVAGHGSDV